jgi:hypothetical protein
VADATLNTNNEQEGAPMNATTTFLETQVQTLTEAIEKKDALIAKLQEELQAKTNLVMTVRGEQRNFINSIKEFTVQAVRDNDITMDVAHALAEIADFELSKTITITATVDFEVEIEVPLDVDADEVISSLEYSVNAFDYSITDYSLDTRNVDWEDTIS